MAAQVDTDDPQPVAERGHLGVEQTDVGAQRRPEQQYPVVGGAVLDGVQTGGHGTPPVDVAAERAGAKPKR